MSFLPAEMRISECDLLPAGLWLYWNGDKEFDPVFTPDMVGVQTVTDVLAALNNAKEIEAQDVLLDKFTVYEVAQRANKEVVTVDIGR